MSNSRIGYWATRGYVQPVRLLLAYTGTNFEDVRYKNHKTDGIETAFTWRGWDRSEWLNEKSTLGLDFPNIPYYIDDDVKLSQTFTILKYLGRKHNLAPLSEEEHIRVDLIEAEAMDMRTNWSHFCYHETEIEKGKVEFLKNLTSKLKEVSRFIKDYDFFAGSRITYIDFLLYELFDAFCHFEPTILNDFTNLKTFHARIESLPTVATYMKSDKFLAKPFNGPMAYWCGN